MCDWPGCGILAWLLKSCLNAPRAVSFESRWRTTQDELGYRTTGEDCWGREKGIFTKRFVLQLKHIGRHDCIWKIISSLDICETIRRNWFHVFFFVADLICRRSLTCTTTPSQSGTESNGDEGMTPYSPRAPELEPHHQMQLVSFFWRGVSSKYHKSWFWFTLSTSSGLS